MNLYRHGKLTFVLAVLEDPPPFFWLKCLPRVASTYWIKQHCQCWIQDGREGQVPRGPADKGTHQMRLEICP